MGRHSAAFFEQSRHSAQVRWREWEKRQDLIGQLNAIMPPPTPYAIDYRVRVQSAAVSLHWTWNRHRVRR